jgi:hypothetical protein
MGQWNGDDHFMTKGGEGMSCGDGGETHQAGKFVSVVV